MATMLMYSFASRKDIAVLDEPLHGYYLGFSGQDRYYRSDVLENMDVDPARILDTVAHCDIRQAYLFVKNITNQIIGLSWEFILNMRNIILIQEPEPMIQQYRRHIPGIELLDLSYEVQYHVLLYLVEHGIEPVVVRDTDLLARPMEVLTMVCRKLELPMDPAMLSWEKGPKEFDGVWGKHWYQDVWPTSAYADFIPGASALPKEFEFIADKARQHYMKLQRYAI